MQVWVFSNEYVPRIVGGLGTVTTQLTRNLTKNGVNVILLTMGFSQNITVVKDKQLRVIRFPGGSEFGTGKKANSCKISKWLAKRRFPIPDLIHVHSVNYASLVKYYQKKWGVPVVYTCHSLVKMERKSKIRSLLMRRQEKLMRIVDQIVVPSNWQQEAIQKLYPQYKNKVAVIENGVKIKKQLKRQPDHIQQLLYVGRLSPIKGIEQLLEAVALLKRKQRNMKLDVIGTGSRAYVSQLKQKAQLLKLQSTVRWLGFKQPWVIENLYPRYGAVIVPSRQESFGLVALEALANGVPLVSTRFGGLNQFVDEKVAEVITEVRGRAIAKSISNVWSEKELTANRVIEGHKLAAQFTWSKVAENYKQLFTEVINNKRGGEQIGETQLEVEENMESEAAGASLDC